MYEIINKQSSFIDVMCVGVYKVFNIVIPSRNQEVRV